MQHLHLQAASLHHMYVMQPRNFPGNLAFSLTFPNQSNYRVGVGITALVVSYSLYAPKIKLYQAKMYH